MSRLFDDYQEECCLTHEGSAAFWLDQDRSGNMLYSDPAEALVEKAINDFHKKHPEQDLDVYRESLCANDSVELLDDIPF